MDTKPINHRKVTLGIIIAGVILLGGLYVAFQSKHSVESPNQVTQPYASSSPVPNNPQGFEGMVVVTDTFYFKTDSSKAMIIYRDTTSNQILSVLGYIKTKNFYSKAANYKLAQTVVNYYSENKKEIRGNLVITSNSNP